MIAETVERLLLYPDRRAGDTDGKLFEPSDEGSDVGGGWDVAGNPVRLVSRALAAAATPAVAAGAAVRRILSP